MYVVATQRVQSFQVAALPSRGPAPLSCSASRRALVDLTPLPDADLQLFQAALPSANIAAGSFSGLTCKSTGWCIGKCRLRDAVFIPTLLVV